MNTGTVQIMWKEIIVGFIILYLLRRVLDAYMIKKYEKLQPEDTLQLVLEAETEEQKEFYEMVGDFLLQKKQREVIERKLF